MIKTSGSRGSRTASSIMSSSAELPVRHSGMAFRALRSHNSDKPGEVLV